MKRLLSVVLAALFSSVALAQTEAADVQRDVCSGNAMRSLLHTNYELKCMKLGKTSLSAVLRDYRVTAMSVQPMDGPFVSVALFIEKADK